MIVFKKALVSYQLIVPSHLTCARVIIIYVPQQWQRRRKSSAPKFDRSSKRYWRGRLRKSQKRLFRRCVVEHYYRTLVQNEKKTKGKKRERRSSSKFNRKYTSRAHYSLYGIYIYIDCWCYRYLTLSPSIRLGPNERNNNIRYTRHQHTTLYTI